MSADIRELIEQIRAGLDGATPGPWHAVQMATNRPDIDRPFVVGPSEVVVGTDGICEPARMNDRQFVEDAANMRYIALLDPDNIRRLLDHIAELEARTGWRPTHRHKKRGSTYQLDGYGEIQTDAPIGDYCKVAIYRAEDGKTWVRPVTEFEDGRFEPLPSSPGGRGNG